MANNGKSEADTLKDQGNKYFGQKKYFEAISCYEKAIVSKRIFLFSANKKI